MRLIARYHGSLLGRDFKAWAQIGVFIVWDYNRKRNVACFSKGLFSYNNYYSYNFLHIYLSPQLFMHSYCVHTCENGISCVAESCTAFVQAVKAHDAQLLNCPKFHMLLHLPRCIQDFGRTHSFNSERFVYIFTIHVRVYRIIHV